MNVCRWIRAGCERQIMSDARASDGATQGEQLWRGVSVSEGVAVGRVLRLHDGAPSLFRVVLRPSEIDVEVARLHTALSVAREQIIDIKERAERELGAEHAYIFDAHLAMVEDRKLIEDTELCVRAERVNAEWAVKVVTDRVLAVYAAITDDYLRARGSDIEDVARRILRALAGNHLQIAEPREMMDDSVVVAEELLPSIIAELDFARIHAIISDTGGWTSHAAIIARGLGIPAIVGTRDLYRRARTGDRIIVDATRGEVMLHPAPARLARMNDGASARAHHRHPPSNSARTSAAPREPLRAADGTEILIRANVELPAEFPGIERAGARGIGLYRSEFLWTRHNRMPTEDEQFAAYAEVARIAGADEATIRLFDFGGDKFTPDGSEPERNPALGLRAIRLGLRHEEVLRTQARALLRVSADHRIGVVLPMIADVNDVRRARAIIEDERRKLSARGVKTGAMRIGAMIEVPAAILTIERIAAEVDFLSLGTNDLVQYLLATDRGNDAVAEWFRTLHPAVLLSVRRTLDAARAAGIPAIVCGEMAATPAYAALLLGLGARELSMSTGAIERVRAVLGGIDVAPLESIAAACLECATPDETEECVRLRLGAEFGHLFTPEMLPAPRAVRRTHDAQPAKAAQR